MIQEAPKQGDKHTQYNNRNIESQRNTKYMDITCDVRLSSANKCHMLYDQPTGN